MSESPGLTVPPRERGAVPFQSARPGALLASATQAVREADLARRHGYVSNLIGLIIEVTGLQAEIGEVCLVDNRIPAEVVGFRDGRTLLMPLGELHGIGPGTRVLATGAPFRVAVGPGLLGRVVDGLGVPLDELPAPGGIARSTIAPPPSALSRPRISERVGLGVRALDSLVPCGRGQRLGIFAGSGVGKSSLMGMIARSTSAQVNVIALVGERGREVREFIERDLGDALERSVVVVATSDQPALVRIKAAFTATTIAEHFRDQGHDVLLMMDSVTRFAMAQREVGLAIGEPPATRGYTPSVFALLPRLLERAGTSTSGSITGPVHGPGRRRRHERADRRRGALDPRRARGAHALARPRRPLSRRSTCCRASRAWSARSSRHRWPPPASACAPRWRCCARRKTSSRSAPTSQAATPRSTPRSPIARESRASCASP